MMNLADVGAAPSDDASGNSQDSFGAYVSGITAGRAYRVPVRVPVNHEEDQCVRGIEPPGPRHGRRPLYYCTQPYLISLYTAKGVPMLWTGPVTVPSTYGVVCARQ
jgi:hypothetical protein